MPRQLVFNEETLINGNIFKFEERLHSYSNKYIENGMILSTYFSQHENATTVDRGLRDIDQLFGSKSPVRYNKILNFPLCGFGQTNPDNTDENQIEDINVEGDAIIIPSTISPKPNDFFMLNHLKMKALFQVTNVQYDSMKPDGFYKIRYRLISTSNETISGLDRQVVETYNTDLNAVGSKINPIIKSDDFAYRQKVELMINKMIESYIALYYNRRHNCFLYHNQQTGIDYFDMCGNQFIANHGLMNSSSSSHVIMLHDKLHETQFNYYYNNSVYAWIELGCPLRLLQRFFYILNYADGYQHSSFALWDEGNIQVMQPIATNQVGIYSQDYSIFDSIQLEAFLNSNEEPTASEYDRLLWKYIHMSNSISLHDISLYLADTLISSVKHIDTFLYTPMMIYIIRNILSMN